MMIHEKLISGQFLLDLKNERNGLLNPHHPHELSELRHQQSQQSSLTAHYLSNHHLHAHQSLQLLQHQPPSPPMSALKMDLYAAYAYQQQQQMMSNNFNNNNNVEQHSQQQQQQQNAEIRSEVLDLSRRCDFIQTPRKTPSPAHTNSSGGSNSPVNSPKSQLLTAQQPIIPSNLLYSAHAQQQLTLPTAFPAGLATLYPALYQNSGIIKSEPISPKSAETTIVRTTSSTPPPPKVTTPPSTFNVNELQTADLLQKFVSPKTTPTECKSPLPQTPTSTHVDAMSSIDIKNARPFKAFPRDPLVIAANFAATDMLLDNPRVERYTEYRKRVLEQIRSSNGGTRTVTNPKMRRINSRSVDGSACRSSSEERKAAEDSSDCDSNAGSFTDKAMTTSSQSSLDPQGTVTNTILTGENGVVHKDAAYYERRRKNNAAAKKSRDRRRIKEDEIAIRAAYLEHQNNVLLGQIDALKAQLAVYTAASKIGA